MTNTNFQAALLALGLDRRGRQPLHTQLTEALRHLILIGQAAPGARLPASRQLALDLSVSRQTALTALDQLIAEGYLETRPGAGTFVARDLPDLAPPAAPGPVGPVPEGPQPLRPFEPGIPDMTLFPHAAWARHLDRAWRRPDPALLDRPDPLGWPPLRAAIAAHLAAWRGIACAAGQVVITSGAVETFELLAHAAFRPGEAVLTEEPGYAPMRRALRRAGLGTTPMPVDGDGALLPEGSDARGAIVTPSRHHPTGMTMPLPRRLALLDWAQRSAAWVIEDDYDSEFRYTGAPLPALASLAAEWTIYVGSFSKLLSPALRLGYFVVPAALLTPVRAALAETGPRASLVPQPALARFMESGEFATHLRRMRRIYGQRQKVLRAALARHLPDHLTAPPDPSGMHLLCGIGPALRGLSDTEIAAEAAEAGISLRALSAYWPGGAGPQGLILGYAGFAPERIEAAVIRLTAALRTA
ncbi:PLP-dependent aminotransferase family protein [Antarcticimicrobium luteum]|uniref:PLP-dependent aminotransferase family protein n=1 Tax=Antarcticimicrobium luteum TaxID=2547397 RepID=A0A4R5UT82_9RHOB|nr:PLP-dependent aminotransferase family protein [Antarcticimicrobium luteum]TDK42364.1 PLP-dependent aminotransferase family protein [Antarcticimicrobium luteum]